METDDALFRELWRMSCSDFFISLQLLEEKPGWSILSSRSLAITDQVLIEKNFGGSYLSFHALQWGTLDGSWIRRRRTAIISLENRLKDTSSSCSFLCWYDSFRLVLQLCISWIASSKSIKNATLKYLSFASITAKLDNFVIFLVERNPRIGHWVPCYYRQFFQNLLEQISIGWTSQHRSGTEVIRVEHRNQTGTSQFDSKDHLGCQFSSDSQMKSAA